MIKGLYDYLFGSIPMEFLSDYDLEDSIRRLRAATKSSSWGICLSEGMYGKVDAHFVQLEHIIPGFRRGAPPVFIGRFEQNGPVRLVGRFEIHPLAKVGVLVWLGMWVIIVGFGALVEVGEALGLLKESEGGWGSVFYIAAIFAFLPVISIVVTAWGKWLTRNDIPWLSRVIEDALSAKPGIYRRKA
jgi:hypothetical protein